MLPLRYRYQSLSVTNAWRSICPSWNSIIIFNYFPASSFPIKSSFLVRNYVFNSRVHAKPGNKLTRADDPSLVQRPWSRGYITVHSCVQCIKQGTKGWEREEKGRNRDPLHKYHQAYLYTSRIRPLREGERALIYREPSEIRAASSLFSAKTRVFFPKAVLGPSLFRLHQVDTREGRDNRRVDGFIHHRNDLLTRITRIGIFYASNISDWRLLQLIWSMMPAETRSYDISSFARVCKLNAVCVCIKIQFYSYDRILSERQFWHEIEST